MIALFYENFVYGKKISEFMSVLQVAVVNGHTAVEKELRKFLKVRKAKCNTGVDYLNYSSKTTHFGVWSIEFWLRSEIGYELWGVPPGGNACYLPNVHTFYFFIVIFFILWQFI